MLCDVVLVADTVEIPAHRALLAACSSYFYAMFTGELTESRLDRITLQVFHTIKTQNLEDILSWPCFLDIQDIFFF